MHPSSPSNKICLGILWRLLCIAVATPVGKGKFLLVCLSEKPGGVLLPECFIDKTGKKNFLSMKIELFVCSLLNLGSVGQTCSCGKLAQLQMCPNIFLDVISLYLYVIL